MHAFSHFSKHGNLRRDQRTSLSEAQVLEQIDRKAVLSLGCIPGFNREHLLLYSEPDDRCFVAVRDRLCGTVVTVLPLDYHSVWTVTEQQCAHARAVYEDDQLQRVEAMEPGKWWVAHEPSTFFTTASVMVEGRSKIFSLFKRAALPYANDIARFLRDPTMLTETFQALESKDVVPNDVLLINVRWGKKGTSVSVNLVHTSSGTFLDERDIPSIQPTHDAVVRPSSRFSA